MTNREAHEEAAGMNLDDMFFRLNGIDPDAEHINPEVIYEPGAREEIAKAQGQEEVMGIGGKDRKEMIDLLF